MTLIQDVISMNTLHCNPSIWKQTSYTYYYYTIFDMLVVAMLLSQYQDYLWVSCLNFSFKLGKVHGNWRPWSRLLDTKGKIAMVVQQAFIFITEEKQSASLKHTLSEGCL